MEEQWSKYRKYHQLSLFSEMDWWKLKNESEPRSLWWTLPSAEITLSFTSTWMGWWWLFLKGSYDSKFVPKSMRLAGFSLLSKEGRWGVYLNAVDAAGDEFSASYWDSDREKVWRGLRTAIKNDQLEWKRRYVK